MCDSKKNKVRSQEATFNSFLAVYNILENIRGYCCVLLGWQVSFLETEKRKERGKRMKRMFSLVGWRMYVLFSLLSSMWKSYRHRYHQKYEKMLHEQPCKTDHVTVSYYKCETIPSRIHWTDEYFSRRNFHSSHVFQNLM